MDSIRRVPTNQENSSKGKQTSQDTEDSTTSSKKQSESAAIKSQIEVKYRKKQLRRQIRKNLEALLAQGDACEPSQILTFIETYHNEIELIRETLSQLPFVSRESFPISMIWQYTSTTSLAEVSQELEARRFLADFTVRRNELAAQLPELLIMRVETTE
jgi:hypothetical protein